METIREIVAVVVGSDTLMVVAGCVAKSSLLLAAAMLAQRMWRKSAPAVSHLVLSLALLGVCLLTIPLPVSLVWPEATPVPQIPVWSLTVPGVAAIDTGAVNDQQESMSVAFWLAAVWLGGLLFFGTRYLLSVMRIHRMAAAALVVEDDGMNGRLTRLKSDLGIHRPVRLLQAPHLTTPIVWGVRRPVVILPETSRGWSCTQLDLVLRHELAHIRRYDIVWLNLATAATSVWWFNPLMWALRHSLRQAAECACDDHVLLAGVPGSDYAAHLLHSAVETRGAHRLVSPGVVPGGNFFLEERIMSVLSNHKRMPAPGYWLRGSLTGLTILLAVGLAVMAIDVSAGDNSVPKPAAKSDSAKAADLPGIDDFVPVETVAEMIYQESPVYPRAEQDSGIKGKVWVKALVLTDGTVGDARLGKTSGTKALDDSALQAARKCRFKPAKMDGKAVACWVMFSYDFALGTAKENK